MKKFLLFFFFVGSAQAVQQTEQKCLPESFVESLYRQQVCGWLNRPDCPPVCPGTEREKGVLLWK